MVYSTEVTGTITAVSQCAEIQKITYCKSIHQCPRGIVSDQIKGHHESVSSFRGFLLLNELLITFQEQYQSCPGFETCSVSPLVKKSKKCSLWSSYCNSHINIINNFMARVLRSHLRYHTLFALQTNTLPLPVKGYSNVVLLIFFLAFGLVVNLCTLCLNIWGSIYDEKAINFTFY